MQKAVKSAYEVPVIRPTRHKEAWCHSLQQSYTGLVNWLLSVCEKEALDFRGTSLNHARKELKELVYPTKKRESRYNCKGAYTMPHSHYYDTAITNAVQLWKGFQTWKDKRAKRGKTTGKTRPKVGNAQPELDATMFNLDIDGPGGMGWITLKTSNRKVRRHIPIRLPNKNRYNGLESGRITSIRLCIKGSKIAFKLIHAEEPKYEEADQPHTGQEGLLVRAFDLGERNLACSASITPCSQPAGITVQGVRIHSGKRLRDIAYREYHLRRKLQKHGKAREIPGRKYREASLRKEESRRIVEGETREVERHLSRGTPVLVALGNLHAPTPKGKGKLSRRLNEYPRGMLRDMFVHNLRKLGLRYCDKPWKLKDFKYPGAVVMVPENGTSQECHECGHIGVRHSPGLFECTNDDCRVYLYDGDVNGAINIGGRAVRLPAIGGSIEELGAVP
jgi:transposase